MATSARLPIGADRAGPCVRTIVFAGLDLRGIAQHVEVRMQPDNPVLLFSLPLVTDPSAEGLYLSSFKIVDGLPISTMVMRIAKATMQSAVSVPYCGEIGDATTLAYGWVGTFNGDDRLLVGGDLVIAPTVVGAGSAPANRPAGGGASAAPEIWNAARLTFTNDSVVVKIDGAELLAPLAAKAQQALDKINDFTQGPTGAAANTFTTLAKLKALDPAIFPSSILADGANPPVNFAYVSGNFTGRTDVVFLNSDPTGANGALVRQAAASIAASLALPGAAPVSQDAFNTAQETDPDKFVGTDIQKLQAAANVARSAGSVAIRLRRKFITTTALILYGNTQMRGDPNAGITWNGPATGNIIQDSSVVSPSDVNPNILLENLEIDGASEVTGDSGQIAINFYRTGNVTMRGLKVHGVGGSGIRFGLSMADTVGVLIENCDVWDCRTGDAIQGAGRSIIIRGNRVGKLGSTTSNFGDTGIALLADFNATTNPGSGFTSDVQIVGNTVIGNYGLDGKYVGNGGQIQTGIAFGPFKIGHAANIRVTGNTVYGCYLNCWGIVMDDVLVANNNFGSHAATATGNVRMDGVTNARVLDNMITLRLSGTGADYSGVLLVAQRNTFGASVFDADVNRPEVRGNTITSIQLGVCGIRATFESVNSNPAYVSQLNAARFEGNTFNGVSTPVSLAPQTGTTNNVCNDLLVNRNKADSVAGAIVSFGGNGGQYKDVRIAHNAAPMSVPYATGSGYANAVVQHKSAAALNFPNSTTTTVATIPSSGSGSVTVTASIAGTDKRFLAQATYLYNNGDVLPGAVVNGSNMTISQSGANIQVNYNIGGNVPVNVAVNYQ